jgi:Holliday junction resolvasome RuvABC DNA-binding subunit
MLTQISAVYENLSKQIEREAKYLKIVFCGGNPAIESTVSEAGFKEGSEALVMLMKTPEELEEIRKQKEEDRAPKPIPTRSKMFRMQAQGIKIEPKKEEKKEVKEEQKKEEVKKEAPKEEAKVEPSQDNVAKLVGMGFTKEQAELALKTKNGNLDQAIEFITSGGLNQQHGELTADDIAKIKQLMELGFTEEVAKKAYIEAGKDTAVASNKLLGA